MSEAYIGAAKFHDRLKRLSKSLEKKPCEICGKPIGTDGASMPFADPPRHWCAEHIPSWIAREYKIANKGEKGMGFAFMADAANAAEIEQKFAECNEVKKRYAVSVIRYKLPYALICRLCKEQVRDIYSVKIGDINLDTKLCPLCVNLIINRLENPTVKDEQ